MIDYKGLPMAEAPGRKVAGANRPVSIPWAQGPRWHPPIGFVLVSFAGKFASIFTNTTSKFTNILGFISKFTDILVNLPVIYMR